MTAIIFEVLTCGFEKETDYFEVIYKGVGCCENIHFQTFTLEF